MIKILITGGAGFIGSNLAKYLINDYKIRVVDNLSSGNLDNLKEIKNHPNFEFCYGDITNLEFCRKILIDIDIISHQAAVGSVPRSIKEPLNTHDSNVNGFFNIILIAKEYSIKRIVYASSSSVYGSNQNLPKIEYCVGDVLSPYACSKKINELYANIFSQIYDMEIIGLRYFNIFGPNQNENGPYSAVIPRFINKMIKNEQIDIYNDGSFSRDFTYVTNALDANKLAMFTTNKNTFGKVFNIATHNKISILELFNILKKKLNYNQEPNFTKPRKGDISHSYADINLAKKELNYTPKISFIDGLDKTISFYN